MNIVILGLSITSSWGNGHATTFRSLIRGLAQRGHDVLFLERDVSWYAENRDMPEAPYCRIGLYDSLTDLQWRHTSDIEAADLVIVGSYVPEGIHVCDAVLRLAHGCTAFYDIDTPVTLTALSRHEERYIASRQVGAFDLYLSFTGGPTLDRLEREFGAKLARPLYCSVNPELYAPDESVDVDCDLGYLGTYSDDRQPALTELLIAPAQAWPAGRFMIAGSKYPESMAPPPNVERVIHLPPDRHRAFYNRLRFALNITRRDMIAAGHSPSVRLFEAAACGTPIISDEWRGLGEVLSPGCEILVANRAADVLVYLHDLPDADRRRIGRRARQRVLRSHTSQHRAADLEAYVAEAGSGSGKRLSAAADVA